MIQADKLTVVTLPQRRLDQGVFVLVPLAEVVVDQTAGVAGVFVKAPECVVDAVLDHEVPEICHPLFVLVAVHESAPFAHEQGSDALVLEEEPVVIPAVFQQSFLGESVVEPFLFPYQRTVVVRGVDQLTLIFAQINGIFLCAPEVSAPPCAVVVLCHGGVVDSRCSPVVALFGVNLRTLDHNQQFRILFQYSCRTGLCGIFPVGRVSGVIPFRHLILYVSCTVRFVFQVDGKDGVIILVIICKPCQRIAPVLGAEFVRVPEADLVTG